MKIEENTIIESAVNGIESNASISKPQGNINNMTIKKSKIKTKKVNTKLITIIFIVLFIINLSFGIIGLIAKINNPIHTTVTNIANLLSGIPYLNDSYKVTTSLNIKTSDSQFKELNNYKYKIEFMHEKDKLLNLINIFLIENDKNLMNINGMIKDNKIYLSSKELYDKVIYYDYGSLLNNSKFDSNDLEYLKDKVINGIENAFKDENINYETKEITINGKKENVKNSFYVIDKKAHSRIINNFIDTVKDDESIEKISKITGKTQNDIQNFFNEYRSALEKYASSDYDEEDIILNVYSRGITRKNIGFELKLNKQESIKYLKDSNYLLFSIANDEYDFMIETKDNKTTGYFNYYDENILSFNIDKVKENEYNMNFNSQKLLSINMNIKYEELSNIEEFDISNAVKYENLSENDLNSIMVKLGNKINVDQIEESNTIYSNIIMNGDVNSWKQDLRSSEAITVLGTSTCSACKSYKPVLDEIAAEYNLKIYFFETDKISEEEIEILENTYKLVDFNGFVPFTFYVRNNKYIKGFVGSFTKDGIISKLKTLKVIK